MKRYFLEIAYNGTHYHGWQYQPNAISVQQKMNEALSTLLNEPINCMGCGRTDTGVHASQFYLHFDAATEPTDNFVFKMNRFLPNDIAVKRMIDVPNNAHSRFDAKYRAYNYHININKSPFLENLSNHFFLGDQLDFKKMQFAFSMLEKHNDFAAFQKKNESKTSICSIYKTEMVYDEAEKKIRIHIAANRFLRGMVRLIVGGLLTLGQNRISITDWEAALKHQTPLPKTLSAPACGLYLSEVRYDYVLETRQ